MNKDSIDYIEVNDNEINEKREELLGEKYPNKKELFTQLNLELQKEGDLSEELTEFAKVRNEIIQANPYMHTVYRKDGEVKEYEQGHFQIMKQEMVLKQS